MFYDIQKIYWNTNFDFRKYAFQDDELSHLFPDWVPYYRMKYAICKTINPTSILETGVRYGYSAITFLNACPNARYLGIDNDTNTFGVSSGAIQYAKRVLADYHADIILADSQEMEEFPGVHWDLIHIDGQQGGDGTFHDLEMAIRKASWILVDGYFCSDENMVATSHFMKKYQDFFEYIEIIPGYAGDLLIKVKENPIFKNQQYSDLQHAYSQSYYLSDCGGYQTFVKTNGKQLDLRLISVFLLANPQKDLRILDIGCGRGELSYALAKAGATVTGIDYSSEAISIAKSTFSHDSSLNLEYICDDVLNYPFSSKFDRIILSDVVEHIEEPALQILLMRCRELLSVDGFLIIHTAPNRLYYDMIYAEKRRQVISLGCWIPKNPRTYYEDIMHINEKTPDSLSNTLSQVFPHYHVWVTNGSDLAGSLVRSYSEDEMAASKDIYAVASKSVINKEELINRISQNPLNPDSIHVSIELITRPDTVSINSIFQISVRLANKGRERLASLPPNPIHVSYHWKDSEGKMVVFDGHRTPLSLPLSSGEERLIMVDVKAPEIPGLYNLVLTLVQELCFWFEDIESFNSVTIKNIIVQ
jgi:2-polyprenyl-3-methyl-5-hydroxy-6-metoxy-1,4-benzoquinol methylase